VLDCVQGDQAAAAFERQRMNVKRFAFPQVGQVRVKVDFTRTSAAEAPSSAFSRADKALYHVKESGRNRVAQYEELVRQGSIAESHIAGRVERF